MDDTLYLFVNKHIHSGFLLVHIGGFEFILRRNGVETSITLEA